ncbi:MAG: NAD(P)/FAD-dependent oxidoreductase, partial [Planctomycetota bacterium]
MEPTRTDCLVIGGGAAGATLALLLARRGVAVTLVDDGRAHYSGPYETVLASTRSTWERLGVLRGVEDGVEADPLRHGAIWGQDELQWRDDPEAGLLLRRGHFDASLRRAAAAAGAVVHEGTRAVPAGRAWRLGDETVTARLVAYATGRRQGVAGLARYTRGATRTVSVTLTGEPAAADRGTAVVEACRGGWLWSYAPARGPATAAALLDAPGGRGGLRDAIEALTASARGPAGRMRQQRLLRANDASPRLRAPGGGALLLGDCAATIDPLASQGVEKAVAAAEHAATVICSALEEPRWWPRLVRALS